MHTILQYCIFLSVNPDYRRMKAHVLEYNLAAIVGKPQRRTIFDTCKHPLKVVVITGFAQSAVIGKPLTHIAIKQISNALQDVVMMEDVQRSRAEVQRIAVAVGLFGRADVDIHGLPLSALVTSGAGL